MAPTWQHEAEAACKVAAESGEVALLWTRGLVRDPAADWRFVPVPESHEVWQRPGCDTFTGQVFGDGSQLGKGC
eukprot:5949408-Lingulodinium_polyedra.AAC.1